MENNRDWITAIINSVINSVINSDDSANMFIIND